MSFTAISVSSHFSPIVLDFIFIMNSSEKGAVTDVSTVKKDHEQSIGADEARLAEMGTKSHANVRLLIVNDA
jgi:hypothetical protein